ncbi:MAG TPA: NAD(P)-dependent alcohol dehydrogenase, partial [Thermoanaerobaculia bacterium]|nr:NAD(P)-dependent alcohol dehydrogenase [Thermoanaerobaculia bacterium]
SVNPLDWHLIRGEPFIARLMVGLRKSKLKRPGADVSGRIEAIGKNVTHFKRGDEVFGSCRGAFAEFACAPESALAIKPRNATFEQAASVPVAGFTALQGLRDRGQIRPGQKVLVNGASGGVGTFAVQIAKSFGADVTGVCSTRNVEMVRSIGADRVIDYTKEDFTRSGSRYDLVLDAYANHSQSEYRGVLNPTGRYVIVGGPWTGVIRLLAHLIAAGLSSRFSKRKVLTLMARNRKEDLVVLRELIETDRVRPVIDRTYTLDDVPQAVRYMEEGHPRGKVVITLDSEQPA